MPSLACVSGEALVTSVPAKTTRPPVGARSPTRQLKKVDLPAPLGPMRPTISPSPTVRSASASAWKLPKLRETDCASSSMALAGPARRQAPPQLEEAARLETGEQQDDAAVEDVGQPGAAAAEEAVGRGLERHQDRGAEQGSEQRADAAQRRGDDHLDRDED